jgi:hypothetical protein
MKIRWILHLIHRYLWKNRLLKASKFAKNPHIQWRALAVGTKQDRQTEKAGRLKRQAGWKGRQAEKAGRLKRQAGWKGRRAGSIDVPALTANTLVAAMGWTSIHNKTDDTHSKKRNLVQNKWIYYWRLFCTKHEHYNYLQLKQSIIKWKLFTKDN